MSYPIETDTIRRVQNKDGKTLDVRPWPEAPDSVVIMYSNDSSKSYFGQIELAMDPEFARHIGRALIVCADEIENK